MDGPFLRILGYHRIIEVDDPSTPNPSLISATPKLFDAQMRHLAQRYRVLSLGEVLQALLTGSSLPSNAVLITFDDAYRDFGEIAWPLLRKHGLSATVFVPTAYPGEPDKPFWWDRVFRALLASPRSHVRCGPLGILPLATIHDRRAASRRVQDYLKTRPHAEAMSLVDEICRSLGEQPRRGDVLTWDQLRELSRDGATVAPHTRTHPALTQISLDAVRSEIRSSIDDVRREIGSTPPVFCYPFGIHDDQVVQIARDEGVQVAVTCIPGHNRLGATDPLRLRRTNISQRSGAYVFRLRLLRQFALVDRWRRRLKQNRVQDR